MHEINMKPHCYGVAYDTGLLMSLSVIFTPAPIYTSSRKQIPPMNFSEIMLRHLVGWLLINWEICFRFNCNRPEHTISTAINLSNKVTYQPVVQVKKKIFVEDCKAIDGQSTLIVRFKSYLFNASWAVGPICLFDLEIIVSIQNRRHDVLLYLYFQTRIFWI